MLSKFNVVKAVAVVKVERTSDPFGIFTLQIVVKAIFDKL